MTDRLLLPLCLGLGLALAGCTPPAAEWSDTQAPKTLRVDFIRLQHAAAFVPGSADLAEGEAEGLAAFLDQAEVTTDDHVYFEPSRGDKLAAARIGKLTREISPRGLGAMTLPATATDTADDRMMIFVERYVVTPPDCPNWTKPPFGDHSNTLPSNFGCADATNLGLMVADPRDLVVGRTLGPVQGNPAIYGYSRYRNDKPKDPDSVSLTGLAGLLRASGRGFGDDR